MRKRLKNPLEVLESRQDDPRLETIGDELEAWVEDDILTIAVRRSGPAPMLFGTVQERMLSVGDGCGAIRVRVPGLDRACIEYGLIEDGRAITKSGVWRGAKAGPAAPRAAVSVASAVILDSPRASIAERHQARFWSEPDPEILMLCADGEGLESWASVIAAARLPVALVGINSAGLQRRERADPYDAKQDPRACAYLHNVDAGYFADHMSYVIESVLPWARERVGDLPTFVFGTSNGASFAATAARLHPEEFAGALVFSLGVRPPRSRSGKPLPHALVAGRLEPGFHHETSSYARQLRLRGAPVRLVRPVRGHDHSMWCDELAPALRWMFANVTA